MRPSGPSPSGTPTEGAGGVVFDPKGRVLLIRQRSGGWVFPKGHLDGDEQHLATALREVEEEAGIHARCDAPERRWSTRYVNDRGEPRHITWFRLEAPEGSVPKMRERQFPEGAFVAPDAALERLTFDEDRALLRRVLADRPDDGAGESDGDDDGDDDGGDGGERSSGGGGR